MSHLERNSEKIQSLYQFYLDVEREKFNEWAKIYLRHLEYFLYSIYVCSTHHLKIIQENIGKEKEKLS